MGNVGIKYVSVRMYGRDTDTAGRLQRTVVTVHRVLRRRCRQCGLLMVVMVMVVVLPVVMVVAVVVVVVPVVMRLRVTVPVPGRNGRGRGAVLVHRGGPFVGHRRHVPRWSAAAVTEFRGGRLMMVLVRVRRRPALVLAAGHRWRRRRSRQAVLVRGPSVRRRVWSAAVAAAAAAAVLVSVRRRTPLVIVGARRRRRRRGPRRRRLRVAEMIPSGRGPGHRFRHRPALRALVPLLRRRPSQLVVQIILGRVAPGRRSRFVVFVLRTNENKRDKSTCLIYAQNAINILYDGHIIVLQYTSGEAIAHFLRGDFLGDFCSWLMGGTTYIWLYIGIMKKYNYAQAKFNFLSVQNNTYDYDVDNFLFDLDFWLMNAFQ